MKQKKVQKRTLESREKINQAAYTLFEEKGYFNTNTKEIAKLAGVSVGNFYNYYKDKGDVYYELSKQYVEGSCEAVDSLTELMLSAEHPRDLFSKYVYEQMERAENIGHFFADAQVLMKDDEKLQQLFEGNTIKMIEIIESMLRKMPNIKKRASYPVMARFLFQLIDSMSMDVLRTKGTEVYSEYVDQLVETSMNYIYGEEVSGRE